MPNLNTLFPVFLKLDQISILVVGGGNVALEKLTNIYRSSTTAKIHLVAPMIRPETFDLLFKKKIPFTLDGYNDSFLKGVQLVFITTDNKELNKTIFLDCKKKGIIANVADTPELCDFYMGSIITKGSLKIALSTNGKSPTFAKRMREWLEDLIPEDIDEFLDHLKRYRETLKGDFEFKIKKMNEAVALLIDKHD